MVPDSFGNVNALSDVKVAGFRVVANAELLSEIINSPVLAILNRVVPEADAAKISPLFV